MTFDPVCDTRISFKKGSGHHTTKTFGKGPLFSRSSDVNFMIKSDGRKVAFL